MPYRHTHDTALHKRTRRNKLAIAAFTYSLATATTPPPFA
jgi:hypothetical protein